MCPTGSLGHPRQHKELALVFFSKFEPIILTPSAVMQRNGVPRFKFYDTARLCQQLQPPQPVHLLGLECPQEDATDAMLGRVMQGNRTPTMPHCFGNRQGAVAVSRNGAGNGSRLYELNNRMWRYRDGRGQPRRVTVAEAELQQIAAISARTRAVETLKRHRDE